MFPTNSERLIGISDAFSAFVYGYLSSCSRAHCTPQKSVPTLHYTRRPGPIYTGHACRHLPSAVPWISKDRLLTVTLMIGWNTNHDITRRSLTHCWCSPLTPWNALICQCTIAYIYWVAPRGLCWWMRQQLFMPHSAVSEEEWGK